VNLDLPFDMSGDEIDDILADLDRALDSDFLREVDAALERIAKHGELEEIRAPVLAAG
jgi:enolase